MKNPLQMYSKIGDLKIIQIKKGKDNKPGRLQETFGEPLQATPNSKNEPSSFSLNRQVPVSARSTDSLVLPSYLPAGKNCRVFKALPPKSIPLQHFIGSLNKNLTTGIIISSKINQLRKDGMSFKYFRYNYLLSQDIGKLSKQPLTYEYKISSNPLLAKKYIKILNGYSFYDLRTFG